nr:MAG TPA: hypothetical protein [Ackermannviridae sp.]DAK84587.1 MAG TPA: hypothetical protein [Caudoviricetes sp.]DAK97982.1 MAG TPA: hypothetical protein [Ackermannviridae sp.]
MKKIKDFILCMVSPTAFMFMIVSFVIFYLLIQFTIKIVL